MIVRTKRRRRDRAISRRMQNVARQSRLRVSYELFLNCGRPRRGVRRVVASFVLSN